MCGWPRSPSLDEPPHRVGQHTLPQHLRDLLRAEATPLPQHVGGLRCRQRGEPARAEVCATLAAERPEQAEPADPGLRTRRVALQKAVDVQSIFTQAYVGRGKVAESAYPDNMVDAGQAPQNVSFDASVLKGITPALPADQKTITIGYDSQSSDNQLVANLMSAQLSADGLTAKVQGFPTSRSSAGWATSRAPRRSGDAGLARRRAALHLGAHQLGPRRGPELPAVLRPRSHQRSRVRARVGRPCGVLHCGHGRGGHGLLVELGGPERLHGRPAVAERCGAGARPPGALS